MGCWRDTVNMSVSTRPHCFLAGGAPPFHPPRSRRAIHPSSPPLRPHMTQFLHVLWLPAFGCGVVRPFRNRKRAVPCMCVHVSFPSSSLPWWRRLSASLLPPPPFIRVLLLLRFPSLLSALPSSSLIFPRTSFFGALDSSLLMPACAWHLRVAQGP